MTTASPSKGGTIHGIVALLVLAVISIASFIPLLIVGLLKLFPNQQWRIYCTQCIDKIATIWTGLTSGYIRKFYPMQWDITGDVHFNPKQWYLVIANHQSWLDIVILQNVFYRKIPVLKFFIKEQLKWVPLFGFAWWAMGCPFMKRYSKEYIEKNPHKKGQDLKATHKALKLFKSYPSSIISFVEGTRYTPQKKLHQQSPYEYLLKPKAGGISQVISAMGKQLQPLIDVTIVYSGQNHSLWDFLCRRLNLVHVHIRTLKIPELFTHTPTALEDSYTQNTFRTWLNDQWATKDALIAEVKR